MFFNDDGVRSHNQIQGVDEEGNLKNIKVNENGELLINSNGGGNQEVSIKGVTLTDNGEIPVAIEEGVKSVITTLMCDVVVVGTEATSIEINRKVKKIDIANYSETSKVVLNTGDKQFTIAPNLCVHLKFNEIIKNMSLSSEEEGVQVQYLVEEEDSITSTVIVPNGEDIALGSTHVKDLQENISINGNRVKGISKYQENFSEFNGSDNSGNFLVLKINEATQGKIVTSRITGTGASEKIVTLTDDGIIIYKIHNNNNKIEIMCEGKETRILELTGLTLQTK